MDIEQLEAKLEALEARISKVDLLLQKPLYEWTEDENEQFGDKVACRFYERTENNYEKTEDNFERRNSFCFNNEQVYYPQQRTVFKSFL